MRGVYVLRKLTSEFLRAFLYETINDDDILGYKLIPKIKKSKVKVEKKTVNLFRKWY